MPFLPQYAHNLDTSLALWLDNRLLNDAQAYITIPTGNIPGTLYAQVDPSIPGYKWASPFKSWVYDDCASGAVVCSGVYTSSGQFLTRSSGLVIDYINGRVISPYNWGATLSGVYSRKQVNVYLSTQEETNFWLEHIFNESKDINYAITGTIASRFAAPCIIITNSRSTNQPFGLGGIRESETSFRNFVIADSNYLQEGIHSLLTDAAQKYVPICTYADAPIGTSGDLKGGSNYNYCTGIHDKYGCPQGFYINNVYAMKLSENFNKQLGYFLSIVEIEGSRIRTL